VKILSECPKWKDCPKKAMVLDKDYDVLELYRIAMRKVCEKCEENQVRA
jgi:hypothetical protein